MVLNWLIYLKRMPIGNLTSQIFANVYLNALDHYVKHDLSMRYYGRYVDDFVLVHQDREYLRALIPIITDFLMFTLKLTLHPRKIYLQHYSKGVPFLGVIIRPNHISSGKRIKGNFYDAIARNNLLTYEKSPARKNKPHFYAA